MGMRGRFNNISTEYIKKINGAASLKRLDELFLELFGKKGKVTILPKELPRYSDGEKKEFGTLFNKLKQELENLVEIRRTEVKELSYLNLSEEKLDLTKKIKVKERKGNLHLATRFKKEIINLFKKLGFEQYDAPHVEWDKYNFKFLNMPKDHPSRDMWDTLYIDTKDLEVEPGQMLLRTHTSNFWSRLMEKGKLPIRAMSFDRCFRYEAIDSRHSHTFNQFEIAVVGKNISMANLRYLSDYFLKAILGKEARSRFRPKYYPFVEPGVGIDSLCVFCHGRGCKICSGVGWFEIAGAGMIHPNVFKSTGLDPKKYTGLAWGFGPDRILMLRHGIEDIRQFLEGDLEFLQEY